tara:strand:+ start:150 stop:812 length:663 start_codon:yes stop_codon:yes gene_type:complete
MNAIKLTKTSDSPALPLDIAKVMKPIIIGKHAGHNGNLQCIASRPTLDGYAEYVATNGTCLLIIETNTMQPGRQHTAWPASQVKTFIDSKGHAPLDSDADLVHQLPDYDMVIPSGKSWSERHLSMVDSITTMLRSAGPNDTVAIDNITTMLRAGGPTDTIGLNTQYLTMMDKISTVFKLSNPHWRCTLHGTLNPTVWTKVTDTHETVTKLTFLVMPVRLD